MPALADEQDALGTAPSRHGLQTSTLRTKAVGLTYPRRQQHRRLSRAVGAAGSAGVAMLLAVIVASAGENSPALALMLFAVALSFQARRWLHLAASAADCCPQRWCLRSGRNAASGPLALIGYERQREFESGATRQPPIAHLTYWLSPRSPSKPESRIGAVRRCRCGRLGRLLGCGCRGEAWRGCWRCGYGRCWY